MYQQLSKHELERFRHERERQAELWRLTAPARAARRANRRWSIAGRALFRWRTEPIPTGPIPTPPGVGPPIDHAARPG